MNNGDRIIVGSVVLRLRTIDRRSVTFAQHIMGLLSLNEWPLGGFSYERHRPEDYCTRSWQGTLAAVSAAPGATGPHPEGKYLPTYVKQEFEAFLACGRLDRGYPIAD